MNSNDKTRMEVTVIGLGQMGSTLAKLLMQNDYRVTVWNRTQSKADDLVKEGAYLAGSIVDAIRASPVVVICVFDYNATRDILDRPEVTAVLKGRTIIQLTTGSPKDAIASEQWANIYEADYLDGAIQVAPEQMAKPDTTIFVSGAAEAFRTSEKILKVFGGNIKYLGERASAAAAMDLASLSYLYGSLLGFFHAVRIAESEGFSINLLGQIISEISPGFADFIKYEAGVIQSGNFNITQSPLSISVEATARILRASEEYGINTDVIRLAANFFAEAAKAGYGKEELASLVKVFRSKT
jgi:3-hydroxyisobutyrate dehydrogenase-like beta-hydroxyacid dehydrogenase